MMVGPVATEPVPPAPVTSGSDHVLGGPDLEVGDRCMGGGNSVRTHPWWRAATIHAIPLSRPGRRTWDRYFVNVV